MRKDDILKYFLIHVNLNFKVIRRVIGFLKWFLPAIFGINFLFHEEIGLDHKVIVNRDVNFDSLVNSSIYDSRMFELLQHFGDFANTHDLILELADERVMENQVTLYFVVDDWVEDELDVG